MRHISYSCDICDDKTSESEEKIIKVQDGEYIFERNHAHVCTNCMRKIFRDEFNHAKKVDE